MPTSDNILPNRTYSVVVATSPAKSPARKSGCPAFRKGIYMEERKRVPYATYRLLRGKASLCSPFSTVIKERETHTGEEQLKIWIPYLK